MIKKIGGLGGGRLGQLLRESLVRAATTVMKSTCSKSWTAAGEKCKWIWSVFQCITLREKNSCYSNSLEKSGCKNQHFCSSSFQINREHASRPTCFLKTFHASSSQDILSPGLIPPRKTIKKSLASALPRCVGLSDRRHQQLGMLAGLSGGDWVSRICALSNSSQGFLCLLVQACLKGKASPMCCNYWANFCSLSLH